MSECCVSVVWIDRDGMGCSFVSWIVAAWALRWGLGDALFSDLRNGVVDVASFGFCEGVFLWTSKIMSSGMTPNITVSMNLSGRQPSSHAIKKLARVGSAPRRWFL